jgi:TonB family protein
LVDSKGTYKLFFDLPLDKFSTGRFGSLAVELGAGPFWQHRITLPEVGIVLDYFQIMVRERRMVKAQVTIALMLVASSGICPGQQGAPMYRSSLERPQPARISFAKDGKGIPLAVCPAAFDDSLAKDGIVPVGNVRGVTPPKPIHTTEAEFSDKARKEINKKGLRPFESLSTIAFVVGTDGNPRDLCVQHSAEFDLDLEAAKAVRQYRFEPAVKDDQPVAKRMKVEIRFSMR